MPNTLIRLTAWLGSTTPACPSRPNGSVIGDDLPSRRYIFEFKLIRAEQSKGLHAVDT